MAESKTTTYNEYLKRFKPESTEMEKTNFKKFFQLNSWQYLLIIAISISGLATFINTYDAWSNINSKLIACTQSDALQKELNTQFIVILVLACVAIVLGVLLAWFFRSQANQRRILTLGIITTGIFGILYALSIKFQNATNKWKLGISWAAFLFFLILGFFLSTKKYNFNCTSTQETAVSETLNE
jgi:uncharacterized membrane protein HdeD (DUF308 family)